MFGRNTVRPKQSADSRPIPRALKISSMATPEERSGGMNLLIFNPYLCADQCALARFP
jgi:hypothetical protein